MPSFKINQASIENTFDLSGLGLKAGQHFTVRLVGDHTATRPEWNDFFGQDMFQGHFLRYQGVDWYIGTTGNSAAYKYVTGQNTVEAIPVALPVWDDQDPDNDYRIVIETLGLFSDEDDFVDLNVPLGTTEANLLSPFTDFFGLFQVAGAGDDTVFLPDAANNQLHPLYAYNLDFGFSAQEGDDQVFGGDQNDLVSGGVGQDTLNGGNGDDSLYGNEDNDEIIGDAGSDLLSGQQGDDTLFGDTGDDLVFGDEGSDEAHGGEGNDTVYGWLGDDTLNGGADDDTIHGDDGEDEIHGGDGDDSIRGGSGTDTIFGGDGNDEIYTDSGLDTVYGGSGDDSLLGGSDADVLKGEDGNDFVYGWLGADTIYGGEGDDNVQGGPGGDSVYGEAGDDTVRGNDGNDVPMEGDSADFLSGGLGNDKLEGELGADTLDGGDGNDTLEGGEGADFLSGGEGDDLFVYSESADSKSGSEDVISDFDYGTDKIDLRNLLSGKDAKSMGNFDFSGSPGEFRLIEEGGSYRLVVDLDGDEIAEMGISIPMQELEIDGDEVENGRKATSDFFGDLSSAFGNIDNLIEVLDPKLAKDLFTGAVDKYLKALDISVDLTSIGNQLFDDLSQAKTSYLSSDKSSTAQAIYAESVHTAWRSATVDAVDRAVEFGFAAGKTALIAGAIGFLAPATVSAASIVSIAAGVELVLEAVPGVDYESTLKALVRDAAASAFDGAVPKAAFLENVGKSSALEIIDDSNGDVDTEEPVPIEPSPGDEETDVSDIPALILGSLDTLDGLSVLGFGKDDLIIFTNTNFGVESLTVTLGSAILDVDADLDGIVDATITLEGNFEGVEFQVSAVGENTEISILSEPTINTIDGTSGSDNLVGTDADDVIRSFDGRYDKMFGGEGADQFVFGAETNNGVRERDVILDYQVGLDSIVLEEGTRAASIRETSSQVVVFLDGDRDAIYVRGEGVTADNIEIITDDVFEFV